MFLILTFKKRFVFPRTLLVTNIRARSLINYLSSSGEFFLFSFFSFSRGSTVSRLRTRYYFQPYCYRIEIGRVGFLFIFELYYTRGSLYLELVGFLFLLQFISLFMWVELWTRRSRKLTWNIWIKKTPKKKTGFEWNLMK